MSKTQETIAFAIHDSGLYPYPEFVSLFTKLFEDTMSKDDADQIERIISGGMNKKRLAKHLDKFLEKQL